MNRMLYCSECCTKKGGRQNKWQKIQTGMEYQLQLMQQLGRQSTAAPLSLPEQLQKVADGWGADAPVDGLQDCKLSQLELLNTDIKQGAEFSRVGNGTIDNVFEALMKEVMLFLIESARWQGRYHEQRCSGYRPQCALEGNGGGGLCSKAADGAGGAGLGKRRTWAGIEEGDSERRGALAGGQKAGVAVVE
jgi:hypothetical protein